MITPENIASWLSGSSEKQLAAISALEDMNARRILPLLQKYLNEPNDPLFKSLLISVLIRQEVRKPLYLDDKRFIAAECILPENSPAYQEAEQVIREVLGSKNPTGAKLCLEVLLKECYRKLPEQYQTEEAGALAYGVMRAVLMALGDEKSWQDLVKQESIAQKALDVTL